MNSESLATRIFKSKYFLISDIMDGTLGSSPSFTWRSLFWGKELLTHGLIWRVRSGRKVSALSDRWIPSEENFKPMVGFGGLACPCVAYFIRTDWSWDREQLSEWLVHADIEDILNIPLSLKEEEDRWFWFHDSKGLYLVRSGYKLLKLAVQVNRGKGVGSTADSG